jgi:hypothetical protein
METIMRSINEAFFEVDAFRKFQQDAGIPREQSRTATAPTPHSEQLSPMELRQKLKRERAELKAAMRAKAKA